MRKIFKKYKIKAKKLYTVIALTLLELFIIFVCNDYQPHLAMIAPLVQFCLIFEKRDIWTRLSEKEKKEILLDEEDVDNFVIGVEKLIKKGKTSGEILEEIKKN